MATHPTRSRIHAHLLRVPRASNMSGARSRDKGARFERELRTYLHAQGYLDVDRTPHSGADPRWKGDLMGLPGIHIEAKHHERLNIKDALRQAVSQARHGDLPIAVCRSNVGAGERGIPFDERTMVTMRLNDFMKLYEKFQPNTGTEKLANFFNGQPIKPYDPGTPEEQKQEEQMWRELYEAQHGPETF